MPPSASIGPLRRWDPPEIGGFALLGRLGSGAMGQVYLGRSAAGRLVAVKTIKVEYAEEPDFRTRFGQEVAAARRVSGAFTAPVVAADPEADVPWLATSYVPAPSLSALVRECGPLSVPAVRWLAAGCAEALESIHAAGLVHRDLKPSNVLVSPDGPRVIDFGVTRAVERIQLTQTRSTVGTPAYMAPEQARDTRQVTTASDVYSLGATMVLAATGHPPYLGDTIMDVLVQLATAPPDLSDLPGELAGIIASCLERDPRGRPTSVALLARLAAELSAGPDARELGRDLLSGPALALIAEYRREPRPAAQPEADDDDTLGSQPGVREPGGAVALPARAREVPAGGSGRGAGSPARDPGRRAGLRGPRSRPAVWRAAAVLVAAAAGLVLVAGGAVLGAKLAGASSVRGTGRSAGSAGQAAGRGRSANPVVGNAGTSGFPPGGAGPPPGGLPPYQTAGTPAVIVSQPFGDTDTVFVIRGSGWPPGGSVTVTLVGHGTSPDRPVADSAGTFNYAINQSHEFFPGGLPPGRYRVVVTGSHGIRRTASFSVNDLRPGQPSATPSATASQGS